MKTTNYLGVLLMGIATACGGGEEAASGGAPATPAAPAAPPSELRPEHLPPAISFVRFGETTPEEVKAQFTADNLFVTDTEDRVLNVRARGPNSGRLMRTVNVVRKTNTDGYIGELGDDYGSMRFSFTPMTEGGPYVLYGVEITQNTVGALCQPGAALAAGTGLEGCDPNDVYRPSAPSAEGVFHACINFTPQQVMMVHCYANGETLRVNYELAVGQVAAP
jgi:hypothetical protein